MGVAAETYIFGSATGRLLIKTTRTGLGAKAGHDLTIEVTRWRGNATIDPADLAGCSVNVEADVDSFEVREGSGGVKALTDADRADIKRTIQEKVLRSAHHPTISFRSTRVGGSAESFSVDGDLTILGTTQPISVQGRLDGGRAHGSATVVQTRWGIKPYSAFFGALRLSDEVAVQFETALTPDG
jgi:polyisoprenoid-binding protein YceI